MIHTQYGSPGRGISPSQRSLTLRNTQLESDIHASGDIPHSRSDRATTGVDYRTFYKSETCFRVIVCLLYQCIQNLQLLHILRKEGQKFAWYRKLDAVTNITKRNWNLPNILILRKHGWKIEHLGDVFYTVHSTCNYQQYGEKETELQRFKLPLDAIQHVGISNRNVIPDRRGICEGLTRE